MRRRGGCGSPEKKEALCGCSGRNWLVRAGLRDAREGGKRVDAVTLTGGGSTAAAASGGARWWQQKQRKEKRRTTTVVRACLSRWPGSLTRPREDARA